MKNIFATILLFSVVSFNAYGAQIEGFNKRCIAPNWQSGKPEVVPELNVYGQAAQSVFAFTKRTPGGHWRIEWNIDRIEYYKIPSDVLIFLYYHECAHATYNNESEVVADCEALSAMDADGYLDEQTYNNIAATYNYFGRSFPSGRCE